MAGLHLLKHVKGLSDEQVCAQWVENPYFQAFCGEEFFRHELPIDRSSMTRWRGRIGPEKLEVLLAETIRVATKAGAVSPREMERVTVDTTVATKAVAHPTDSHLLLRAIEWMKKYMADWDANVAKSKTAAEMRANVLAQYPLLGMEFTLNDRVATYFPATPAPTSPAPTSTSPTYCRSRPSRSTSR